jgi:hypothetical protein
MPTDRPLREAVPDGPQPSRSTPAAEPKTGGEREVLPEPGKPAQPIVPPRRPGPQRWT